MFPFISSVQAQNCQVLPSCAELGYTKTVELCEGQAYLTCPFDKSQVYCPFDCESKDCAEYTLSECPDKGICEECVAGCGNKTIKYKFNKCSDGYEWNDTYCIACDFASGGYTLTSCPANETCASITCGGVTKYKVNCATGYYLANGTCNKIQNAIAFVLSVNSAGGGINIYTGTANNCTIDWGDGFTETFTNTALAMHTYSATGEYQIVITGNVPTFYVDTLTNSYPIQILSVDLDTLSITGKTNNTPTFKDCSNVTGTIPNKLPPNLTKGYSLYYGCKNLTGSIPSLPAGLTDGYMMFYNCKNLTGNIPILPSGLTIGRGMFGNCSNLSGNIPTLPAGLTDGNGMFSGCKGLSGTLADSNISNTKINSGGFMFSFCTGLNGGVPQLPSTLTDAMYMFNDCTGLTGNITSLPTSLTEGQFMFSDCSNLSGIAPTKPANLTSYGGIFKNTQITNDGSWPDSTF